MVQKARTQEYKAFDDEDPPIDGYQPPALSQGGNKEEPQEIRDKKQELRSIQIEIMKLEKVEKGQNAFLPTTDPTGAFLKASIKNGLLKKETELKLEIQELQKDHKTMQRHAEVIAQ